MSEAQLECETIINFNEEEAVASPVTSRVPQEAVSNRLARMSRKIKRGRARFLYMLARTA